MRLLYLSVLSIHEKTSQRLGSMLSFQIKRMFGDYASL